MISRPSVIVAVALAFNILMPATHLRGAVWYVDTNAPGPTHDGLSWQSAFLDLQEALGNATLVAGDEIRVAQGTYRPATCTCGSLDPYNPDPDTCDPAQWGYYDCNAPDAPYVSFELADGVQVFGGFWGTKACDDPPWHCPDPDDRDVHRFETILSGDLCGNDEDRGAPFPDFECYADNSRNVVRVSGTSWLTGTLLDGFTIRGGSSDDEVPGPYPEPGGGGIRFHGGTAMIRKCVVKWNYAASSGGGLYNYDENDSRIVHTVIAQNRADGHGGGLSGKIAPSYRIVNCEITENYTIGNGGGISFEASGGVPRPVLVNTVVARNSAPNAAGGGIHIAGGAMQMEVTNSTVADNSAAYVGGGIFAQSSASLDVNNSIIWANQAAEARQILQTGASGSVVVQYSDVQRSDANDVSANVTFLQGNLGMLPEDNPGFISAGNLVYGYRIGGLSRCIDAGNASLLPADVADLDADGDVAEPTPLDLDLAPRQVDAKSDAVCTPSGVGPGAKTDMGAYERPLLADCNANGEPDCQDILSQASADCNADLRPDECGVALSCPLGELDRLQAPEPDRNYNDEFASAVAMSDAWAAIGAPGDNCPTGENDCGSVYVFSQDAVCQRWEYQHKLTASVPSGYAKFGSALALSGNTLVVGAPGTPCALGQSCGAVDVFSLDGSGAPSVQRLIPAAPHAQDEFGRAVAISGSTIAIGAPYYDHLGTSDVGAVYLFTYTTASGWIEVGRIVGHGWFGVSLALRNDVLAVGGGPWVHVYRRDDNGTPVLYADDWWVEESALSIGPAGIGASVSIVGDILAVGHWYQSRDVCDQCGAVYIYRRTPMHWVLEAEVRASDAQSRDWFGYSLEINAANMLVVGAPGVDQGGANGIGAVYVYWFDGAKWGLESKRFASDGEGGAECGDSLDMFGDTALTGAPRSRCGGGSPGCGAAYLLSVGTDVDRNCDGNAEECDVLNCIGNPACSLDSPAVASAPHDRAKSRYVSFAPTGTSPVAYRVSRLSPPADPLEVGWVGAPVEVSDGAAPPTFVSGVVCAPVWRYWTESVIHVGDCEIFPSAEYEVRATIDGQTFSAPLAVATVPAPVPKDWGDTVGSFVAGAWDAPNGIVNVNDFVAVLQGFERLPAAPHMTVTDVVGSGVVGLEACLNGMVGISDVFNVIKAFQGDPYPAYVCSTSGHACSNLGGGCAAPGVGVCVLPDGRACPTCPFPWGSPPPPGDGSAPLGGDSMDGMAGAEGFGGDGPMGPESGVAITVAVGPYQIQGEQAATVEVFVDSVADLGAYETALLLTPAAGSIGTLALEALTIETARPDFVFGSLSILGGANVTDGKAGAALMSGAGTAVTGPAYLATYTYRASTDAAGVWEATASSDAYLLNGDATKIDSFAGNIDYIRVGIECTLDPHCDDANLCTTDTCVAGECQHTSMVCDDGNACTIDTCVAGACQFTPIVCNDANACTSDACVGGACVYTNRPSGTSCNDGMYCTRTDTCNGAGACVGSGDPCRGNGVCCEADDTCIPPGELCGIE